MVSVTKKDQNLISEFRVHLLVAAGRYSHFLSYIEFLMVEFSKLAKHNGRTVSVLGHSTGQGLGAGSTHSLLVMGDIADQQRAELRNQLQTERLPEPEDGGQARHSPNCSDMRGKSSMREVP